MNWNAILLELATGWWGVGPAALGVGKAISLVIDSITRRREGVVADNYVRPSVKGAEGQETGTNEEPD